MRILIADDHAVIRRGLKEILAEVLPDAHFSEAEDGEQALRHLADGEFSALFLDINMPGRSGLEVLQDVKRTYARLPVIVVSVQPVDQYEMRCLRAGASAYINKENASDELALVAKGILCGAPSISPGVA